MPWVINPTKCPMTGTLGRRAGGSLSSNLTLNSQRDRTPITRIPAKVHDDLVVMALASKPRLVALNIDMRSLLLTRGDMLEAEVWQAMDGGGFICKANESTTVFALTVAAICRKQVTGSDTPSSSERN